MIEYFSINKSPFNSPIVNFLILFFLQIFFKIFAYFMSSSKIAKDPFFINFLNKINFAFK